MARKATDSLLAKTVREVFVHYSGIVKDGFKALNEKQEVEYELGEGSKGIQAINVKVVE